MPSLFSIRRLRVVLAWLGVLIASSCGDSSPVGPTPPPNELPGSLAGTWAGPVSQLLGPSGTATLVFQGPLANGSYEGTWSFAFADTNSNRRGTFTTTVPQTRSLPAPTLFVDVVLTASPPAVCAPPFEQFPAQYEMSLGLVTNRLTGENLVSECGQLRPGRVELSKR